MKGSPATLTGRAKNPALLLPSGTEGEAKRANSGAIETIPKRSKLCQRAKAKKLKVLA
jgi:hypothetical protein